MAMNIKDPQTEHLAAEVAALASETKTRAINIAPQERHTRLTAASTTSARREQLRRFLSYEAWPQIPQDVLGAPLSKADR